ncbi:P-loop containing nucleoside triphosphate hydrolase protein [Coemansia spiralis]|nr:P-loop containing nucleoside triphosphate hydrolase protein [Coemansia spiralis]
MLKDFLNISTRLFVRFIEASAPTSAPISPVVSSKVAVPTKEINKLKIGSQRGQSQGSGSDSSRPQTPVVAPKKRIDVVDEYSKHQKSREALNLVVVGHVDAGKSTLMGHLLYALGQVNERTIKKFERDAERIGKGSFAYAWVLDETEEERSRGVTMDVATSSFATDNRKFTLLDAPGHRDFVPNMISGASRADVAMLVVDASTGEFESGFDGNGQTREHAILIRSLGVRQLVVAVNKLDMVGWDEGRYSEITGRLLEFLLSCGYQKDDVRFVPVSGLKGTNLVCCISDKDVPELAAWYKDEKEGENASPCLVDLLDTFTIPERPVDKPFRLSITDFFKGGVVGSANSVSVSGRIAQGNVQLGEQVVLVPGGERGTIKAIDVDFVSEEWAVAGDSVVLMIQGIDIQQFSIGSIVCSALSTPVQAVSRFEAQLVIFDPPVPITNGFPALIHIQSLNVPAAINKIIEVFDQRTGEVVKRRPRYIRKGATARVEIVTDTPVCLELFKDSKELGRIMLRKNGETIAAGIVTALFSK